MCACMNGYFSLLVIIKRLLRASQGRTPNAPGLEVARVMQQCNATLFSDAKKTAHYRYRGGNKGLFVLLSNSQAGPGRTFEQEQEEISRNHVQTFISPSVYN